MADDEADEGPADPAGAEGGRTGTEGPATGEVPLILDAAFVADAAVREPSAEQRARHARIDAEHRRLVEQARRERRLHAKVDPHTVPDPTHQGRPGRRRWPWLSLLLAVVLGGAVVWVSHNHRMSHNLAVHFGTDQAGTGQVSIAGGSPPPGVGEQAHPLGQPAPAPAGTGPYRFMVTQSGRAAPVAYDPCRPIHVVVNDRTAPPDGDALLRAALARASQISGLTVTEDGPTDEAPSTTRPAYQPDRYPGRWAPVLVAWSDPAEYPRLGGDVAGLGGSDSLRLPDGTVYVSGQVVLDGPELTQILSEPDGRAQVQAVIEHELGHLLGLDHVSDPSQIMNPTTGEVTDYAAGDQLGLEALGRGKCFPQI